MDDKLFPIITDFNVGMDLSANLPMEVTLSGITIPVMYVYLNADSPIVNTVSGIVITVRSIHPKYASSGIAVTEFGICTIPETGG